MIKDFFEDLLGSWRVLLKDRAFRISFLVGILVTIIAVLVVKMVGNYNDTYHYGSVGDLILNKVPTYDLSFLFTWGFYFLIILIILFPAFRKPELVPFAMKTFSLLVLVRACFTILTQVGPPDGFFYDLNSESLQETPLRGFIFRNDLFFSGHVAIPFMAFLLFRESIIKWVFLIGAFVMGITVLLFHAHYSIDVFAAFFITYGIFALSNKIFKDLNIRFKKRLDKYKWKKFMNKDIKL